MATSLLRLAALWLGLTGPPDVTTFPAPGDLPARARVAAESIETYAETDTNGPVLDRLKRGDLVEVVDADHSTGWLTIRPPATAFAWVDQSTVRPEGPGSARVTAHSATCRAGMAGARLPGPPRTELPKGTVVKLLDRPPIQSGSGLEAVTWLAIAVPPGDVRHISGEGLEWPESDRPEPAREVRAGLDPPTGDLATVPAETALEIRRVEAEHRSLIAGPIEQWRLDGVRTRYDALLAHTTDPAAQAAIRARLDLVARHVELSKAARTIQTILERSRRRDHEVERTRRTLAALEQPRLTAYAAEGLVQSSSRQVDGRRVFALIGPKGNPVAYLDIPPGLETRRVLARRVGVRGSVHYDDQLGARLIAVREIEPLD